VFVKSSKDKGLRDENVNPPARDTWHYPKSPLHQAAIDAMKPQRDLEAGRSMAAQMKLRREREAALAAKDLEVDKLAILANTERLRAVRLAREDEARVKNVASGKPKRGEEKEN
jgi:hypothetical protein